MTDKTALGGPAGVAAQPLNSVQWIDRNLLRSNSYNPNHVAPPEMKLLKTSILSDGWTQPIVARSDYEIVDGFHRWSTSKDPEVSAMTGGLVPVVFLSDEIPLEHQMMSTVRHNRARGTHGVMKMADIIGELLESGVDKDRIAKLMQMESQEVDRLAMRGNIRERHGKGEFSKGFRFVSTDTDDDGNTLEG
jgi:hypothetical protein